MYPVTFAQRLLNHAAGGLEIGNDLLVRGKTGFQLLIELDGEKFDLIKTGGAWWLSRENNHHNKRLWIGSWRLQWSSALGRAAAYLRKRSEKMKGATPKPIAP
jgi:hypothetical protein